MGSGHEAWVLCTGKIDFPSSSIRFRINFFVKFLFTIVSALRALLEIS